MCRQVAEVCGRPLEKVRQVLFDSHLQRLFETGQISEPEFQRRFEQALDVRVDPEALRLAASDIFELNPEMVPLVEQLRRHHIRLLLFSNTCVSHYQHLLDRFPLLRQFDDAVLSFEVGALKPEPPMYEAALSKIGCEPSECFYTDDQEPNVLAGRRFGLDAERFVDAERFAEHLRRRGLPLE